ncbi:MAG: AraC family transcriptional regulator [Lachnospiraceae bacterium]|nr:AraC family transcriptional regulator [Lachnospiraceae bacterium]
MQINIEQNQKEIKKHGSFAFPLHVSLEHIEAYEQGVFLWHWHPEIELTWIISGEIEYRVNDKIYYLREGEGLFGNSQTLHAGCRKDRKPCTYLSITFHPRLLYGYDGSIFQSKYVEPIIEDGSFPALKLERDVDWHQDILRKMQHIQNVVKEQPDDYEMQAQMALLEIWRYLYKDYMQNPHAKTESAVHLERLREMLSYMEQNYSKDINLDDIAAQVNICKSECCRFFKKHMNMTILEYLMSLRIQKSIPLLKKGKSVAETAGLVGFASPAYFGQIFKRYMHCTPKSIQKEEN